MSGSRVSTRVTIDPAKVNVVLKPMLAEAIERAGNRTKKRAQDNIKSLGRVDTGDMLRSISVGSVQGSAITPRISVYSTKDYAGFQERGTRAHGPARAQFMVFTPKGGGGLVFTKWVRGVKAGHFMRDAMRSLSPRDFMR